MKSHVRALVRDKGNWAKPLLKQNKTKEFRGWYSRGYLPHFDAPDVIQFLTFNLHDAIPAEHRPEWEALLAITDERERRRRMEDFLDHCHGTCALRDPRIAALVEQALLFFDGQRYRLCAWVVMPNHVHALIEIIQTPIAEVLHSWKSYTANEANKILRNRARFWAVESFDQYIRDEEHFRKAVRYIETNPVKAGLVKSKAEWLWSSAAAQNAEHRGADHVALRRYRGLAGEQVTSLPPDTGSCPGPQASSLHQPKLAAVDKRRTCRLEACGPMPMEARDSVRVEAYGSMRLGIFAKTFIRPSLEEVLDAVVSHGLQTVQFNFACAGLESMPEKIDSALLDRIRHEMEARQITMAAVSGTFNMIHPDRRKRSQGLRRLGLMTRACEKLGTSVITLCTGTRDPENMWRHHPENASPEAWHDLILSLRHALKMAEENQVTLGVEPEVSNVIDSPQKARRLLDEMRSPRLKIVMDGANLFRASEMSKMYEILDEAFRLVGPDIVLAHAKDVSGDGEIRTMAAGKGKLDYDHYLKLLRKSGFNGPFILHGLAEKEVGESVEFLRKKLRIA